MANISSSSSHLLTTPLIDLHRSLGAKMVDFAGFYMPLYYEGIVAEHIHTRRYCSLFDVSHMGQAWVLGHHFVDVAQALQRVIPANLLELAKGKMCYSLLLNQQGGIVDDLIITRLSHSDQTRTTNGQQAYFHIVVNASRKKIDYAYFKEIFAQSHHTATLQPLEQSALIALQGPNALSVLKRLNQDITTLDFMNTSRLKLLGIDCWVSRCGYTGEMGFEIATDTNHINTLCTHLLEDGKVKMAGLGARDSLRIEAGLPLYGNDMDEETTPVEANLNFSLNKKRLADADFVGASHIIDQLANGTEYCRIGLSIDGRAPIRQGARVMRGEEEVGVVTSGCFSPTLKKPIAVAKLKTEAIDSHNLCIRVRNNDVSVKVNSLVFVPTRYK